VATAAELLHQLRPGLIPVPAADQPGICRYCHSACGPDYGQCYPCREASRIVGVVEIVPISMSVGGDLLHRYLRGYKDDRSDEVRHRMGTRLAALMAVFLGRHSGCIGDYDSVVPVPSPIRTATDSILRRLPSIREVNRPALRATGVGSKHELRTDRFALVRDVRDERILVVDDTFTSGATMFSAVATLKEAGAVVVGPVVLGRHVRPEWDESRDMLSWLGSRPWDDTRCCRCDGERQNPDRML
jgi:hypothetical protein